MRTNDSRDTLERVSCTPATLSSLERPLMAALLLLLLLLLLEVLRPSLLDTSVSLLTGASGRHTAHKSPFPKGSQPEKHESVDIIHLSDRDMGGHMETWRHLDVYDCI